MKKIFLALAALATLAACIKSEVTYEPAGEITFSPVTKTITKAMMVGTDDNSKAFITTEKFNVWAFYNPTVESAEKTIDEWVSEYTTATGADVYLDNKTFAYDKTYKLWAGDPHAYFWPKVGSLAFAGYHPVSAPAAYTLETGVNQMVFTDVKNGWVLNEKDNDGNTLYTEDLMYFNLTKGFTKNNVVAVFKHALSWITVNVATTAETLDAGAKIEVSSVKFTAVEPKGTGTVVNQGDIAWDVTEDTEGYNEAADDVEIETVGAKVNLTADAYTLKEPLLVPQEMNGNLEITYTITSKDDSYFEETKVIVLNKMKDNESNDLSKWEAAKHYIYNIVISTEEILIDASVNTWTDVKVPVEVK